MKTLRLLIVLCLALLGVCSGTAFAKVAANTKITNVATLYYNDGTGTRSTTASVDVTVSLVSALGTLTSNGPSTVAYTGPAGTTTVSYTVTANSNGPEQYTLNLSVPAGGSTNTSGGSVTPVAPFILGATVTIDGSTMSVLNVPSDGVADSSVNGIKVGDTVVVNNEPRLVTAISDPAGGTATITLQDPLSAAPGAGVSVLERVVIPVTVSPGTIQNVGTDLTVSVNATLTNGAGTTAPAVSETATFTSGNATLVSYVRNASREAGNSGGAGNKTFVVNGTSNTYYRSGVTAQPGEMLEYVLEATNNGTGAATNCKVVQQIPGSYVSFSPGSYGAGKDLFYADEAGGGHYYTQASSDDPASLSGSTITINIGTGADVTNAGSLATGKTILIAYQVQVKN